MFESAPHGLFVGLTTLDVIHRVSASPGRNEKVTANAQFVAAGGPAANAAVAFAALGGRATLLTVLGSGPIARTVTEELRGVGVRVVDAAPDLEGATPVSSVAVIEGTGERSVIGGDARALVAAAPDASLLAEVLADADVALFDGHHPELSAAAAEAARRRGVPSVLDAGRWKPIMPRMISAVSDVVASADFRMPGTLDSAGTADGIVAAGAPVVVTTNGADPVRWSSDGRSGTVPVPRIRAVDTLGAGDVFHGAYAFALALGADVPRRIAFASEVAATRCAHVGPRAWLDAIAEIPLPSEEPA